VSYNGTVERKIVAYVIFLFLALLGVFLYEAGRFGGGRLRVVFCDVGQGDGIYIRMPTGQDVLIDGGPNNEILLCLSKNMPFWDRKIELMVLTHPDADHYTGLLPVAKQYEVGAFATSFTQKGVAGYQMLSDILREKGTKQRFVCQNDAFRFGEEVSLRIVWPRSCTLSSTEKNDNSVIAVLAYEEFQVLLTGDAEENIGDFYQNLAGDVDILKVPHHGSAGGVDEDYLQAVSPEVAILSTGVKNRYGHPAASVVKLLEKNNIKIFRTDRQGDIVVSSDGNTYTINSSKD
jgi:competence protein ComEC